MHKQKTNGFTLVELIVVITILAILGTIAFISLQGYSTQARDSSRISDISSIKTSLELFQLDAGKYPNPTSGVDITYSGAIVWNQGIFGETVYANVDKLDKIPLDPLTNSKYTYSVTQTKNEYELGGIIEGDIAYYGPPLTPPYQGGELAQKVNAGTTEATAYITGNYNGQMTKSLSGVICNVFSIPTIIASDIETSTDLEEISNQKRFVYNGQKNLPNSFRTTKFNADGGFDFKPNKLIAYTDTGSCNNLIDKNDAGARIQLLQGLQEAYTGTTLKDNGKIKKVLDLDIDTNNPSQELLKYAGNFVNNNLGGTVGLEGKDGYTIPNSCETQPNYTNATFTEGTPTQVNQSWQNTSNTEPCYYECNPTYVWESGSCNKCNYGETVINGVCTDPYWQYTSALLRFNGSNGSTSIYDEKGSNGTGRGGQMIISTTKSKFGGSSAYFDGSSDSANLIYFDDLYNLSNTDFTIETWINLSSYTGRSVYGTIFSKKQSTTDYDYTLYVDGINKSVVFGYGTTSTAVNTLSSPINTIDLNTWYHIAVSKNGNTIRLFINGEEVNSTSINENIRNRNVISYFGISFSQADRDYSGYIDEFRLTKGYSRYNSSFETPTRNFATGSNNALLMHFDGANGATTFTDYYGHNFSRSGTAKTVSTSSKFGGTSLYTYGSNAYISGASKDFLLGNQPFTFEFWANTLADPSPGYGTPILTLSDGGGHGNGGFGFSYSQRNGSFNKGFTVSNPTTQLDKINVFSGTWHHFVIQRESVGGNTRMFVDGISVGYLGYSSMFYSKTFNFGFYSRYWGQNKETLIDEVRLVRGVALYSGNFTPPSQPYED
ncbi:MAG: prepilin-type N-terminal cleavage/methylation domain-containing protein [Candidatus Gracilibacteria bacterium]|nr:prepilin-type N-terminal cleavage/methylation domain-containing protein [Candidatus Gracilibacteria bacterium]